MLDINQPYESWAVLTHMNWDKVPLSQAKVKFSDLGLPSATYSVFEFWSKKYLGDFTEAFTAKSLDPKSVATYSIRRTLDRPQILSTSRHISQGGVDLETSDWKGRALIGSSKVVRDDPYSIFVRLPEGYTLKSAAFDGRPAEVRVEDGLAEVKVVPKKTGSSAWRISF
jgi:hypothetical protein